DISKSLEQVDGTYTPPTLMISFPFSLRYFSLFYWLANPNTSSPANHPTRADNLYETREQNIPSRACTNNHLPQSLTHTDTIPTPTSPHTT
ncbi:hypothetical protein DSO57_1015459, partial [Entomophthora muscae]